MDFVVTDAEYQTFGNTRETWWTRPGHHKEIFQIGAAKVISGEVVDRVDIIIKPSINPILTPESIKLSWVSQERIDSEGGSYVNWYRAFMDFTAGLEIYTYDNDQNVHLENALLNQSTIDRKTWIKVREKLISYGINPEEYSSWDLFKALGLDIQWHVHDAFHDSHSLALALIELKKRTI